MEYKILTTLKVSTNWSRKPMETGENDIPVIETRG
jgi:hypothetical protein